MNKSKRHPKQNMTQRLCGICWQLAFFLLVTATNNKAGVHALAAAFRTERVTTTERILDVHVFRRWSLSVDQYMSQNPSLSHDEAWETLTRRLQVDDPVQFVAVIVCDDEPNDTRFEETHGVVGSVDATPSDCGAICLKNLRVDERVRRQGIASALIRNVVEYAYPRTVVLATEDQQSLYAFHGFVLQEDGMSMVLEQPQQQE